MKQLCNFIVSSQWEEHYESKGSLPTIKTLNVGELENSNNTVVMFEKEGCEGCKYIGQSLEDLSKVIRTLRRGGGVSARNGRAREECIGRLNIGDPLSLSGVSLRRVSVFNDHPWFKMPSSTPKLMLFLDGSAFDLRV